MTDYKSQTDHQLYDELLNTYYQNPNGVQQLLTTFANACVSNTRIKGIVTKANKKGGTMIDIPEEPFPKVLIEPDKRLFNLERSINSDPIFQNVCDKFLLEIYGKKFNSGVNGAFGEAQKIQPEAKKKHFVIRVPKYLNQNSITTLSYSSMQVGRFNSSVDHYCRDGYGKVSFEYY